MNTLDPASPRQTGSSIVILGLTITSSWGNGHATTFRTLVRGLAARGHRVLFLECDKPWYAAARDLPEPPYGETRLYDDLTDLEARFGPAIAAADLVIVGSYVPDGVAAIGLVQRLARGLTAFYDIDTPVTLAALADRRCEYLAPGQIAGFDLYLSFTGGPTLRELERVHGARAARALHCAADPDIHRQEAAPGGPPAWDLGYLGTYSPDRQPTLERLLCEPAAAWHEGRFVVAGPQYPETTGWPPNVARIDHLPPDRHAGFYCDQRFTLNVTRADMIQRGYSPSVRLFEAASCGTPIISDAWPGLAELFRPGREILIVRSAAEVTSILRTMPEAQRRAIGAAARARVLAAHTGAHRAAELEQHMRDALAARAPGPAPGPAAVRVPA